MLHFPSDNHEYSNLDRWFDRPSVLALAPMQVKPSTSAEPLAEPLAEPSRPAPSIKKRAMSPMRLDDKVEPDKDAKQQID
jgi:hypothetical protein